MNKEIIQINRVRCWFCGLTILAEVEHKHHKGYFSSGPSDVECPKCGRKRSVCDITRCMACCLSCGSFEGRGDICPGFIACERFYTAGSVSIEDEEVLGKFRRQFVRKKKEVKVYGIKDLQQLWDTA